MIVSSGVVKFNLRLLPKDLPETGIQIMFHYYMLQFYYFLVVFNYNPPPSINNSIKVGTILSIGQFVP
ncbi:hypothetical protein CsSME_00045832 [Camellia sinensis var. sinensis]